MTPRRASLWIALLALALAGCGTDGCDFPTGSDDDEQTTTVAGTVTIAGSDSVLAGVAVTGTRARAATVTNANGQYYLHFEWSSRTIAAVNIRFTKTGFASLDTTLNVATGISRGLDVELSRAEP